MKLIIEAVAVGILVVIMGTIVSNVISLLGGSKPSSKDWNKNHVMEIALFFTGVLVHLVCEFSGINKWYCKNGNACAKK